MLFVCLSLVSPFRNFGTSALDLQRTELQQLLLSNSAHRKFAKDVGRGYIWKHLHIIPRCVGGVRLGNGLFVYEFAVAYASVKNI